MVLCKSLKKRRSTLKGQVYKKGKDRGDPARTCKNKHHRKKAASVTRTTCAIGQFPNILEKEKEERIEDIVVTMDAVQSLSKNPGCDPY